MAHLARLMTALVARRRIGRTCPETHACRRVHTGRNAKLAPKLQVESDCAIAILMSRT
jgi:hypothetical protein